MTQDHPETPCTAADPRVPLRGDLALDLVLRENERLARQVRELEDALDAQSLRRIAEARALLAGDKAEHVHNFSGGYCYPCPDGRTSAGDKAEAPRPSFEVQVWDETDQWIAEALRALAVVFAVVLLIGAGLLWAVFLVFGGKT